jgi:L-fuculose-phosphate aldolase
MTAEPAKPGGVPKGDARTRLAHIAALIYAHGLSDATGGNLSMRESGRVFMTPRYLAERDHWRVTPSEIVEMTPDGTPVANADAVSREVRLHLEIYRAYPPVGAIVHAHPPHALVFAAAQKPIPCVGEAFDYYGIAEIPVCSPAPAGTPQLSASVLAAFGSHPSSSSAYAAVIPNHGVVIAAPDLDIAYSILDGAESMARVALMRKLLE